jgi:hypothetical protein
MRFVVSQTVSVLSVSVDVKCLKILHGAQKSSEAIFCIYTDNVSDDEH